MGLTQLTTIEYSALMTALAWAPWIAIGLGIIIAIYIAVVYLRAIVVEARRPWKPPSTLD